MYLIKHIAPLLYFQFETNDYCLKCDEFKLEIESLEVALGPILLISMFSFVTLFSFES